MGKEVYFLGQIDVKDFEAYMSEYGMTVVEQLMKAGAEVLVGSPEVEVLEGEWPGCWTVLFRFPSIEAAKGWYDSEEYEPFKQLRIQKLTNFTNAALLPSFDPASLGL
jgi:uncharacterized protein (DUF1330 family)